MSDDPIEADDTTTDADEALENTEDAPTTPSYSVPPEDPGEA